MRLLHSHILGGFSLETFYEGSIPPYAILSHTWGPDDDEVSFEDLRSCSDWEKLSLQKPGFKKLHFCALRAAADGLQYFWVDTCCINKLSDQELSEAINSMFRWYQHAAKCYVYLSDFVATGGGLNLENWKMFRKSRWFTRGWTLQELLAAKRADFFDAHGEHIGDNKTLNQWISNITRIPTTALRGQYLQDFDVGERLSWAQHRQTKREEDAAYSMMGIFDVSMPLIYGEGRLKAYHRLFTEIRLSGETRQLNEKYSQYLTSKKSLGEMGGMSVPALQMAGTSLSDLARTMHNPVTPLNSSIMEHCPLSDDRDEAKLQNYWDASIAENLDHLDDYHDVHVLIIKWQDSIDQLNVRQEVWDQRVLCKSYI